VKFEIYKEVSYSHLLRLSQPLVPQILYSVCNCFVSRLFRGVFSFTISYTLRWLEILGLADFNRVSPGWRRKQFLMVIVTRKYLEKRNLVMGAPKIKLSFDYSREKGPLRKIILVTIKGRPWWLGARFLFRSLRTPPT